MGKGRNRGEFSEGGRMGFEPVENVGLAAKESAQEILKIFSQVHEPRVVRSRSLPSTQHPAPTTHHLASQCPVGCPRLSYRSAECAWVGSGPDLPAPPPSQCC